MKRRILAAGLCLTLLGACSKSSDSERLARKDSQQLGSATDIADPNTGQVDRNERADAADNGLGGPSQRESGNFQTTKISGANMPDDELEKSVKVALSTGSTGTTGVIASNQLTAINVKASNGVVTLSGPVKTAQDRRIVEKQVQGMRGVRSVIDNLEVISPEQMPDRREKPPLVPLSTPWKQTSKE